MLHVVCTQKIVYVLDSNCQYLNTEMMSINEYTTQCVLWIDLTVFYLINLLVMRAMQLDTILPKLWWRVYVAVLELKVSSRIKIVYQLGYLRPSEWTADCASHWTYYHRWGSILQVGESYLQYLLVSWIDKIQMYVLKIIWIAWKLWIPRKKIPFLVSVERFQAWVASLCPTSALVEFFISQ